VSRLRNADKLDGSFPEVFEEEIYNKIIVIRVVYNNILFSWIYDCTAQQQDTLYLDPASGNYIIEYRGYFPFARGTDGVLRRLRENDSVKEGEEYIEKDSMLTVVLNRQS